MLKIIGLIRRRADFTPDAFSAYWRTTHRAEAEKLRPWLRAYVQNHLTPLPGLPPPPADGAPLLWVDGPEALQAMLASDAYRTGAYEDEPRFMEGQASSVAVMEEVVAPPPAGDGHAKAMLFRTAGNSPAMPRAIGIVRNHALPGQEGAALVEEYWWPDEGAMRADLSALPPDGLLAAAAVRIVTVFAPAVAEAVADEPLHALPPRSRADFMAGLTMPMPIPRDGR